MKLEHRKERIVPLQKFFIRLARYGAFAAFLVFVSLGIGTTGYYFIAELSWIDSFHMSCMILTGMGPVAEMKTNDAKMFSSLYALYSGLAFLSTTAIFFTPIVHRLLHILHVEEDQT